MKKQKVLVVGGAGYIGSHMVRELIRAKWDVVILDNLSTGNRRLLAPDGIFVQGDLGDSDLLDRIFSNHRIAAVMHFAAFSQVGESVQEPLRYYHNNLAKTITLLDAMRRHRVARFIFSSTAAVYGEPEAVPIDEMHPCLPTSPYGNTKLAVERMLADCDAAFGLKSVALRYFNAAGADPSGGIGEMHDPETHLIPIVLKAAAGKTHQIQVFGTDYPTTDGTCIRDYIHVNDLARAHLLALNALLDGGGSAVYNLGSSAGHSVRAVIETAERITGISIPVCEAQRRAGDPAVLIARSEKIKKELGWRPAIDDLTEIIASAWRWHASLWGH